MRWKRQYILPLSIPPASEADKAKLSELAEACRAATVADARPRLQTLEAGIDRIVHRLFALTEAEIHLIEAPAPT